MFTGIIESAGRITDTREVSGGRRLCVETPSWAGDGKPGDSIAVSGVCLTVAAIGGRIVEFDVIQETLDRTTLGSKRTGDRVNLERSLRAGDRLDGHFVQGHVDGTARVERVQKSPREHVVWLAPDAHLRPYIIPKGSVALDGVSLTIANVAATSFSVALIPTTLERTTFAELAAGDVLNVESDILTRTIVHHLSSMTASSGLTLESLRKAGFA